MKKLLLAFALVGFLSSCNKDAKADALDSTETETTEMPETSNMVLNELSVNQASDLVTPKTNDTLYVTNFWATWCPPCVREIPHFKEQMDAMEGQPVKFTFVSLDPKTDWDTKVQQFGKEHGISDQIVFLDGAYLAPEFFKNNFKTWDGGSIPFTIIQKGDKSVETVGGMSKEMLVEKINSLN